MKNTLLSLIAATFLIGCNSNEATKNETKVETEAKKDTQKVEEKSVAISDETAQKVKDGASAIIDSTQNGVNELTQKAKSLTSEMSSTMSSMTKSATETMSQSIDSVKKEVLPVNGSTLFAQKCSSCHGVNAEKKAMNASAVIKGWDKQKVEDALNGYKNGTYGGAMKAIMTAQASSLNEEQISALATYISKQ